MIAVAADGTVVGDMDTGTGDATRYGLIGHDGVLKRLPTGVRGNRQLHPLTT